MVLAFRFSKARRRAHSWDISRRVVDGEGKLKTEGKCCEASEVHALDTRTSRDEKRQPFPTRIRRIEKKLSSLKRWDGKVNCRLCYTSGNDVADAKRPESCRRDAENVRRRNREKNIVKKERKRERDKDVRTRTYTCATKCKYIWWNIHVFTYIRISHISSFLHFNPFKNIDRYVYINF